MPSPETAFGRSFCLASELRLNVIRAGRTESAIDLRSPQRAFPAFAQSTPLIVSELTRCAGIKLNERVSLRQFDQPLSWSDRAVAN
jgi:hypothetical protein